MYVGLGTDYAEQAAVQAFVERVAAAVKAKASDMDDERAAGMRDAVRMFEEAAQRAGLRDHGAGMGVTVVAFDGIRSRDGREIVPAMRFGGGRRID